MVNRSSKRFQDNNEERVAISRAELSLLILLVVVGMGTWVWVDREVNVLLKPSEPREEQIRAEHRVAPQQDEVQLAQNERKAIEEQLIQARLEQNKQSAIMGALVAAFPELTKSPAAASKPISIPADTVQAYRDAQIKELIANRLVQSLSDRLELVRTQEAKTSTALEQSQHSASAKFHQSHAFHTLGKRALTFLATLLIVLLVIVVVSWFVSPRAGRRFVVRNRLTFQLVIGILFVLFAYQAFELAGAAFVGVVVLLILFQVIPWPVKTQPLVSEPKKEVPEKK